jgi:S-adenosylmethionine hydrolase
MNPIITLTSDFGLADHYVGAMKGVISRICPNAKVIDITHEIPLFNVYAGAYAISQAAPYFPAEAVHVVVVDPGVGTSRRGIAFRNQAGGTFIAPDNGVLTPFWPEQDRLNVRELTNESLWLSGHSITFHGRDLFAPAAAKLAAELIGWADLGPPVLDVVRLPNLKAVQGRGGQWAGTILSVDRFGNVITNLPSRIGLSPGFAVTAAGHEIRQFRRTFGEAAPDELFVYAGSSGYYEIGINQQSAAERLGVVPGHPVLLAVSA